MNNKFLNMFLIIIVGFSFVGIIATITNDMERFEGSTVETFDATGDLTELSATFDASVVVGQVRSMEFSDHDIFLAVGISGGSKLRISKRDELGDFNILAPQPSTTLLGSSVFSVEFSDSAEELIVGHNLSPYITVYDIVGDTFTVHTDTDLTVDNNVLDLKFYDDDNYVIAGGDFTNYLQVWKYEGGDYTKLTGNIDILPSSRVWDISYDNGYLFIATTSSPYLMVYRQDGDDLIKLDDPSSLPVGSAYGIDTNDRGDLIALAIDGSPYAYVYKFENEEFTLLSFDFLPVQTGTAVAWSVKFIDNTFLYVGGSSAVYKYKINESGNQFIKQINDLTTFTPIVYVMDHTHDLEKIGIGDDTGSRCYNTTTTLEFDSIMLANTPTNINSVYQYLTEKSYTLDGDYLTVVDEEYDEDIVVDYDYVVNDDTPIIIALIPTFSILTLIVAVVYYMKKS